MNKLVIVLAAVIALAAAEPPSSYGAPSAPIYISDGGYDGGDTNEGASIVDDALLARIAQILSQSESSSSSGGYSAPSNSYGPPSNSYGPPSNSYGAPSRSGGISLGHPERAQLISEFELQDNSGPGAYGPPARNGGPY